MKSTKIHKMGVSIDLILKASFFPIILINVVSQFDERAQL